MPCNGSFRQERCLYYFFLNFAITTANNPIDISIRADGSGTDTTPSLLANASWVKVINKKVSAIFIEFMVFLPKM